MPLRFSSMSLSAFFNDRNFRYLSGKYPQAYGNIATTKLIQWKTAKMRGNKPFHGFGGFIFWLFEPFFVVGLFQQSFFSHTLAFQNTLLYGSFS